MTSAPTASGGANCYRQCTGFRLDPPVENPVDVAVNGDLIAIADYEHGVLFVTAEGRITKRLNCSPYRICGVCYRRTPEQIVLLGYHDSKWFIVVYSIPSMVKDCCIECPSDPPVISWAKRKIAVFADTVYVLATCETMSAVWSLHIPTSKWSTVLFEREQRAAYSDMDVGLPFNESETVRLVLCVEGKSRLKVVTLGPEGKILRTNTIKVRRNKEQHWVVRGPKLVVCDENKASDQPADIP
ncbi:hypothetical protein QR680_011707 [Steinernema hermaphroditum]|uniref:Uncharacterized protein n=1 Tax=Steinernema hermaphroditum TaxID=289476 RepID=A0AA39LZ66_9BILA|nr:hypothetical protein QR680_011707 [Steinernema hermaphroditum]